MVSPSMRAIARRRAEARMTDSCVIVAEVKSAEPDRATGKHTTTREQIYSGPCEFVAANTAVRDTSSGSRPAVEQGARLSIPVDAEGSARVQDSYVATVTLSSHDASSAPLVVRVEGGHHQTFAAARRLPVKVVSGG